MGVAFERLIGRRSVTPLKRLIAAAVSPHALSPGRCRVRPVKKIESEPGEFEHERVN